TRIDVPYFTKILPERSGGRIEGKTSTHAEMSLSGTEIIRLVRSGQVDIGASTLTTVSGDVPLLDGVDLTGLSTESQTARKIGKALLPAANKELEKFGVQLLFMYPFPGQEVFCRRELSQLTDLKGRKVRTFGPSLTDFFTALGAQPASIGFP